jgi:hypothetical protein
MSTRGFIAREKDATAGTFEGRYHHWDSYPTGLGKTLWDLYHGHFDRDAQAMQKFLLDEHTGWSTINGADFSLPPGYGNKEAPQCYCHGARSEEGWIVDEKSASGSGCEFGYVFLKDKPALAVLSSYCENGQKMVGAFGGGDPNAEWKPIAIIDLNGPEPDWARLER